MALAGVNRGVERGLFLTRHSLEPMKLLCRATRVYYLTVVLTLDHHQQQYREAHTLEIQMESWPAASVFMLDRVVYLFRLLFSSKLQKVEPKIQLCYVNPFFFFFSFFLSLFSSPRLYVEDKRIQLHN